MTICLHDTGVLKLLFCNKQECPVWMVAVHTLQSVSLLNRNVLRRQSHPVSKRSSASYPDQMFPLSLNIAQRAVTPKRVRM